MSPPDPDGPEAARKSGELLVLYDGGCPFCRRCVGWAKARDHAAALRFLPYDACPSPPMTPALRRDCERSLHLLAEDGAVIARGGMAVVAVFMALGWPVGWLARRPFSWVIEAGYRGVAAARPALSRVIHD